MLDTKQFYDDLSSYYPLIFENWETSMARQGDALVKLIDSELGGIQVGSRKFLMQCVALELKPCHWPHGAFSSRRAISHPPQSLVCSRRHR